MVTEAGWGTTSFISMLAGTLVAFGSVTLLAAAAGAAGSALGLDTNGVSTDEWRRAGIAATAVATLVLFGSFFLGGYTAGRMSWRAGARHGLGVALLSIIVIAAITLIAWAVSGDVNVGSELEAEGVPTDGDTWSDIGLGAAIAGLVAVIAGSLLGGVQGDRWHGRLAAAWADHRERAEAEREEARRRRDEAPVGTTPADDIDLRDDTREPSVEEERERARSER